MQASSWAVTITPTPSQLDNMTHRGLALQASDVSNESRFPVFEHSSENLRTFVVTV